MEDNNKKKRKQSSYNKKRYEENKKKILQYRKERYAILHQKDYGIAVVTGDFTLTFE